MEIEEEEEEMCEVNDDISKKMDMSKIQYSIHKGKNFIKMLYSP